MPTTTEPSFADLVFLGLGRRVVALDPATIAQVAAQAGGAASAAATGAAGA